MAFGSKLYALFVKDANSITLILLLIFISGLGSSGLKNYFEKQQSGWNH